MFSCLSDAHGHELHAISVKLSAVFVVPHCLFICITSCLLNDHDDFLNDGWIELMKVITDRDMSCMKHSPVSCFTYICDPELL